MSFSGARLMCRPSRRNTRIPTRPHTLLLAALAISLLLAPGARAAPMTGPLSVVMAPSIPPRPTATPMPAPRPPPPEAPETLAVAKEALPAKFHLRNDTIGRYVPAGLSLPAQGGYAEMPGVLTFRGGPYRQKRGLWLRHRPGG